MKDVPKTGSVVRLASGGPSMTVSSTDVTINEKLDPTKVTVRWFDKNDVMQRQDVPIAALEYKTPDDDFK